MAFSQIVNNRLSDKVVQVIMDMIINGDLKPGDRLPNENALSSELGVSRGILREALTILQARNCIIRKQKEGTFINPNILEILNSTNGISLKEATFLDMIEMRECIEQRVVEKVIDYATDEEIKEIITLIKEKDKVYDHSIDYYFHYRLAELSKNAMFINFIDTYYDIIDELTKKTTQNSDRKKEISDEHLSIINAIFSRDKIKAKNAILQHLSKLKELAIN